MFQKPDSQFNNLAAKTISGSHVAGGNLTLNTTTDSSKGKVLFGSVSAMEESTGKLSLGHQTISASTNEIDILSPTTFCTIHLQNATTGSGKNIGGVLQMSGIDMTLIADDPNATLSFGSNAAARWKLDASGHFAPITDSVYDLGLTLFRPRDLYLSGAVKDGDWQATEVAAAYGGTGLTSYTAGDLLYASGTATLSSLPKGTSSQVLHSGTNPSWGAVDLAAEVTGILPVANGGSGTSSAFTQGSVIFAGSSGTYSEDNANFFWDDTNNALGIGITPVNGTRLTLPSENDAATPTLAFGDGDTGFYESSDDTVTFAAAGAAQFKFSASRIETSASNRFALIDIVATSTTPNIVPSNSDTNTGIGRNAADQLSLIAGGVEGQRITALGTTINGSLVAATGDEYALDIAYTTNKATSGDDYGLRINQTDTASPGTSYLAWLGVGGTSKFNVDNGGDITATGIALEQNNSATSPTIRFGDGDSGFFENADDVLGISNAGTKTYRIASTILDPQNLSYTWALAREVSTTTNPVFTFNGDLDTGIGGDQATGDTLSIIAGGVEGLRITETGSAITGALFGTLNIGDGGTTDYTGISATGDVLFHGAAGLAYGEISVNGNTTETTISGAGTAVQYTYFDTNGASNNVTPDHTNDHITIDNAGDYLVTISMHVESVGGAGSTFAFGLYKNNGATEITNVHGHRDLAGGGGETGSVTITGICSCSAADTLELWVTNETNTQNIIIEDATFSVVQVGG